MIKQRFNLFTHILLFEQEIRRDRQQAQINRSINQLFTSAQAEGFLQNSIIGTIATSLKKISTEEQSAKRPWYQLFSSRERPMRLRIVERVYTGATPLHGVSSGACAEIATGAPLPDGADAVVRVE